MASGVEQDPGLEGAGDGVVEFVAEPAEVVQVFGGGGGGGFDLDCGHMAVGGFGYEVDLSALAVAVVREGAAIGQSAELAGDLVDGECLQQRSRCGVGRGGQSVGVGPQQACGESRVGQVELGAAAGLGPEAARPGGQFLYEKDGPTGNSEIA